ncbi:MAG: hypothetical protein HY898_04980 [Deltaproteobacteria bacterium]|nr:hypothetical protein [Deltaproteobacteria bacterium]
MAAIIAEGLAFSDSTSSDGLALQPGVVTAGIGPAGATSPIVSFDLTPKGGQRAFAIAAGSLQPSKDHAAFRLLVVDTSSPTWSAAQVQPNP